MSALGHIRTVGGRVAHALRREGPLEAERWEITIEDPVVGTVGLSGELTVPHDGERPATELLVALHGLAGCAESGYVVQAARIAAAAGVACLRLNLRGADGQSSDYYHAGLTSDLAAALASESLAGFSDVYLLGFSMGGHVALRYAAVEALDPRVRAAAAICAPLDLQAVQRVIDKPLLWPYRRYLLASLADKYAAVAGRREVHLPVADAAAIRTFWDWDERVVAPRHGFAGAEDYYARASVASHLSRLAVPALMVAAKDDPLVPPEALHRALAAAGQALAVRWVDGGGHLGFSGGLELGFEGDPGLERQTLAWLRSARGA